MTTRITSNGDHDYPAIDDEPDDVDYGDPGDYDLEFMDPGGRSALRAGKRDQPCPTCHQPNRLCAEDVARHYQCDSCADKAERGVD